MNDKALEYIERIEEKAREEFGENFTIKAALWNDGDFRIVAYCNKQVPTQAPWGRMFVEIGYQDSKMPDGKAVKTTMVQTDEGPRNENRQDQWGESDEVDI